MSRQRAARWARSDAAPRPEPGAPGERSFPLAPIIAFVAIWLGVPGLIVGAWLAPLLPGGWLTIIAAMLTVVWPVRTLVRGFRGTAYPSAAARLFVVRPFWYAMLCMPVLAAATLAGGLTGLPFGLLGPAGRWSLLVATGVLGVAIFIGYLGARKLVVRQLDARLPRLPAAFDGLKVVQISDLHVGPHTSRRFLERVVRAAADAQADLLVFTGDQVDDFARDVAIFGHAFRGLRAPLGTFVVAGNHDIYAGWSSVQEGLEASGFAVLVNAATPITRDGQRIWIAGTGDPAAHGWPHAGGHAARPDIDRTLADVRPDETVLALAHNPALWPALAERGVDLTLSGHTHYGQLAIPRLGWSMASPFLKLAMGAHRHGRSLLYINPGTNYWGLPFRIGTPPEVSVLTLHSAPDSEADLRAAHQGMESFQAETSPVSKPSSKTISTGGASNSST